MNIGLRLLLKVKEVDINVPFIKDTMVVESHLVTLQIVYIHIIKHL